MPLLQPSYVFKNASYITASFLKEKGIKALLLDVDNTLTGHGSQELPTQIAQWLQSMKDANIKMYVVSNNLNSRVKPFADKIGLPFQAFCCKPSTLGLSKARKHLGLQKKEIALVGDQVFTDVIGGNIYGIATFLCIPMYEDHKFTIRLKRKIERPIIDAFINSGGKIIG